MTKELPLPSEKTVEGARKLVRPLKRGRNVGPTMLGRQESKENPGRVGNTERRLEDDCGGDVENPRGQETPP